MKPKVLVADDDYGDTAIERKIVEMREWSSWPPSARASKR
jgi:hypothetical protein